MPSHGLFNRASCPLCAALPRCGRRPHHPRARTFHKARALLDAGLTVHQAGLESGDLQQQPQRRMHARGQQKRAAIATASTYFKDRVEGNMGIDECPPGLSSSHTADERVWATVEVEG